MYSYRERKKSESVPILSCCLSRHRLLKDYKVICYVSISKENGTIAVCLLGVARVAMLHVSLGLEGRGEARKENCWGRLH